MGLSAEYKRRFFETSAPYRFIELNFKHFLGRAPRSQAEISEHTKILAEGGYELKSPATWIARNIKTPLVKTQFHSLGFLPRAAALKLTSTVN